MEYTKFFPLSINEISTSHKNKTWTIAFLIIFFFLIYNAISSVIVFQSPFFSPPTRSTRFRKCHIPSIHPTKFNFPRDVSKSLNDNVFGKVTFNGGPLSGNSLPLKIKLPFKNDLTPRRSCILPREKYLFHFHE